MPRVLLIGNHPEFKRGLEASHELTGCEIVTAAGNVDAVHHVRVRAIEVVITDPDTPVLDDLALMEELLASRPGIKAIVLAPAAAPSEFIEAVRSHVFACFVAPFDLATIADMTKRALEAVDSHILDLSMAVSHRLLLEGQTNLPDTWSPRKNKFTFCHGQVTVS